MVMKITKTLHTAIQCATDEIIITDEYITELQESCGKLIEADTVSWDSDEDNLSECRS